ncbi:2-keto-3-deoxy-L-rhamnonate aldolase [Macadamia integrifolia]|uniref:2-keto-3-deoxy-L-rhamnonate aldolase n=1 Tax=Macadamia integrifolia TaxID=60698 RepID=UPI001C4F498B|nr:2-keto-3-deoxy-L-rhamnonate aldolase [Macadamia integrifolia]
MVLLSCKSSSLCSPHTLSSPSLSLHPSKALIKLLPFRFRASFSSAVTTTPHAHLLSHSSPSPITPLQSLNPKSKLKLSVPRSSSTTSDLSSTETSPTALKTLKSRLADGDTLYGLFLLSFSPTMAEIAGLAGYDFVVVDMEHGPGGISDALPCLRALGATGTPAILRLPECSAMWAKKALDLGPQGIMFPMIDNPKLAKKAVSYCRFPPAGERGSAHTVVRASKYGIDPGYLSNYEEELLIMCQVESEEGVEKIEDIAAVDGVDCIQMGPLDLSASLGYLWDPGNRKVREVIRKAEKAVLESRKTKKGKEGGDRGGRGAYLGGFAMPHDSPDELRARGYHMVSGAVDVGMFRSAAVEDVKRFRLGSMKGSDNDDGDGRRKQVDGDGKDDDVKYWSE